MKPAFNLRSSLESLTVDYMAAIRDEAIQSTGLYVTLRIPKKENNLDEYINYTDKNRDDFYETQNYIVPKFKEYRRILSKHGNTAEENYTLECAIPSALHLPQNSRVILSEFDSNEHKVVREWRVLSTVTKQLSNSKSYTRVAYLVPDRTTIRNTVARLQRIQCVCEFDTVTDYIIKTGNYAYADTRVNYYVDNKKHEHTGEVPECICTVKWNIIFPSILY